MRTLITLVCLLTISPCLAEDIDKALTTFTEKLSGLVKENGKKKITVLDFTDLNGSSGGELGKYIAEQMTVEFVMQSKKDFSVLDRANLRKILAEHKLKATGLVDPENAKKIGQFAGVDALILGTIIPKTDTITLNAKIITTDTAEIVGAARSEFKLDAMVQKLLAQPGISSGTSDGSVFDDEKAKVVKTIGDLRVEIMGLSITRNLYTLSYQIHNQSAKQTIWVALENGNINLKSSISDASGNEFVSDFRGVSGIKVSELDRGYMYECTDIPPKQSIAGTVKFASPNIAASPGSCRFQLALAVSMSPPSSGGTARKGTSYNITGKIQVPEAKTNN